ncbi:hypothetical protein KI387_005147, partial [Taxus chinensis]
SYESDVEFSKLIVATNQVSASSFEDDFSDSDQGYDSLPRFHCNMIRSSYEHPFISPSSIVLKQKLDTLQQELTRCPPHMVNLHYSLQAQIYELQNQLDAKIQQENHEDIYLASQRSPAPTTSFAPYQFSLPSGRGRGRLPRRPVSPSFGRGSGTNPRSFPFLFPEENITNEEVDHEDRLPPAPILMQNCVCSQL